MRYETFNIETGNLRKNYLNDFLIHICDVPEHPDYPEHTHDFTELVIVYEGSGINCVDEFEYPMSAGDVFVIHEGAKHSYRETKHLHLCNVLFDSSLLDMRGIDMSHLPGFHALFLLESFPPPLEREISLRASHENTSCFYQQPPHKTISLLGDSASIFSLARLVYLRNKAKICCYFIRTRKASWVINRGYKR